MLKPDSCIWGVWHVVWHRAGELGSSVSSLSTDSLLQKDSSIQDPVIPSGLLGSTRRKQWFWVLFKVKDIFCSCPEEVVPLAKGQSPVLGPLPTIKHALGLGHPPHLPRCL